MTEKTQIISFQKVDIFQQKNLILDDVTFSVFQGEFCYLIGKTGSGKSSLLKTLYGEVPVTNGEATIAGTALHELKKKDIPFLRRKLGIVFQDFQLLTDRSVFKNLEFVLKATGWTKDDEIKNRIVEVLEKVGLATKDFKMPHELSGGEQQRVVIARALLNNPEVILADEPTGNLDPETSDEIMKLLHQIASGGTAVIMATHDYRLIDKFNSRILKCENGRLIENFKF
ncbi:MAG: ATP-binding cassette domain-containing protein [Bacteroidia bacterium]|nr:ATP-binding cassette domain-containing protein [Bacteroidia bacterium]